MKRTNTFLLLLLFSLSAAVAQTTRIKDISLTDTQANSSQWIVTDDTSDNLTKKMTLSTLFGGWSGGLTLTGSPLTLETLTLNGSALNDGRVVLNPLGGTVDVGSLTRATNTTLRILSDAASYQSIQFVKGATQIWGMGTFAGTEFRLFDITGGTNAMVVEPGLPDLSVFVDSAGHVGFGADPTAAYNFLVNSTDTTFVARMASAGLNAVMDFRIVNDAQAWGFQVDGGTSDRFELNDVTGATVPVVIETTPPANSLYIDTNGDVLLQDSTSRLTGLTIRPGGDAGTVPSIPYPGIGVINTSAAADHVAIVLLAGSSGQSHVTFGTSVSSTAGGIHYTGSDRFYFTTAGLTRLWIESEGLNIAGAGGVASHGGASVLGIANGTAPTSSPANAVLLYSEDVAASAELKVRDEGGTVTTLSPHGFTLTEPSETCEFPWAFTSLNQYLGVEVNVDMCRVVELLEDLTGERLIHVRHFRRKDWDQDTPPPPWLARKIEQQIEAGR